MKHYSPHVEVHEKRVNKKGYPIAVLEFSRGMQKHTEYGECSRCAFIGQFTCVRAIGVCAPLHFFVNADARDLSAEEMP